MKLLAILKDSLREAVDAKVFYVMVGMSVLLTMLAATVKFTPAPAGKEFLQFAALPLMFEKPEDLDIERMMQTMMAGRKDGYQVVSAEPVGGAPDAPDSAFRIVLRFLPISGDQQPKDPSVVPGLIRDRYGVLDAVRLVDVSGARPIDRPADLPPDAQQNVPGEKFYEVEAHPTPIARRYWPHTFSILFGAVPLGEVRAPLAVELFFIEDWLVGGLGAWLAVLVSIVITAFFIPNMLRKGTVDLLLVKPVWRTTLLLYKYVGGLTFIFLNTALAVLGVWVALGLRSGVWASGFLYMIPAITFSFAILYAVSTLFAVLTRSPIVAILMTCGFWVLIFLAGAGYGWAEQARQREEKEKVPVEARISENWFAKTVYVVHYVLPRKSDLDHLTTRVLMRDLLTANQVKAQKLDRTPITWGESLTVSGVFIVLMLGLSCWRFATKDF